MAKETWYIMEDGSNGDPREIAPGDDGVLRHSDGRAVAYAPHGPRSRAIDAGAEPAKTEESDKGSKGNGGKDMKAGEQKAGYKTRENKVG